MVGVHQSARGWCCHQPSNAAAYIMTRMRYGDTDRLKSFREILFL